MGTHLNAVVTSSEDEQSPDIQKKSAEESETKEKAEEVKPKAEEVKPNAKKVKPKKKQGNVGEVTLRVSLPYKPKGEMFAVAETFQGGSRLQVICEDGIRRMGRIPGKLRRRMWVRENDLLIVVPWSFQDSKADVKFRYTPTQTANLKRRGKIPEILDIY
ncbi:MAG: translation initiation factor eIF-1A [Candidatus Poseidoniia archaeon]|jgi:translation initiation factor 1A|nr:translation initiation factor eIF-1A [Candidatus Poseidoniia archaeon]MDP6441283.1 translation initiation factor eIF-1A [Candidatus Poseidoniia archaeon]MDP6592180.1 translation initiation factor eIF-1A [Candidatus Poseidoniia archaeon]MDP7096561.1 translation initiation factor eIF-1A [Candidatus Poseidoniia archaeon]MDP7188123.1 translation initiation factor eIF-1A [Candidatus Poseidoniia archaeon]|tara:strand:- start:827 stop:1306 length:480 start_codon:yes stop_codon:yes gene_type:complete